MDWIDTGRESEPDSKKRVCLGSAVSENKVRYRIMKNKLGQILLDPVKSVPAYEAWVWENPEIIAAFNRSVLQAEKGETTEIDLSEFEDD